MYAHNRNPFLKHVSVVVTKLLGSQFSYTLKDNNSHVG